MNELLGIHHVTAFAKSPADNLAFYRDVLGLRLVKQTVNFDDPLTYHLYYGDHHGTPGTLLTHFPNPRMKRGTHGVPEIDVTVLAVAENEVSAWVERLRTAHHITGITGDRVAFEDPDGMRFEILPDTTGTRPMTIDAVKIRVADPDKTAAFLSSTLGFAHDITTAHGVALRLPSTELGGRIEVEALEGAGRSHMGAGTVHHVAWRVADDDAQARVAQTLIAAGIQPTPQMDRQYFRSIYFRIPGGVIFEVATDGPGFDADEPLDQLGSELKLPPQHEPRRGEIERHLEPLGS